MHRELKADAAVKRALSSARLEVDDVFDPVKDFWIFTNEQPGTDAGFISPRTLIQPWARYLCPEAARREGLAPAPSAPPASLRSVERGAERPLPSSAGASRGSLRDRAVPATNATSAARERDDGSADDEAEPGARASKWSIERREPLSVRLARIANQFERSSAVSAGSAVARDPLRTSGTSPPAKLADPVTAMVESLSPAASDSLRTVARAPPPTLPKATFSASSLNVRRRLP